MAMEASSLPEPEDDDANLAIARAGSLLVEEGLRPKVGSAAILEPGATSAAASAKDQTKPATAANKAKTTAKSASPKSAGSSGAKAAKPKAAAAPRPNISVILVNETGRPNVGEDYRMVLSRMGYKVVSVTERGPSGAGGQTVITYQSGQQSQARALARRLPGPRQLVASQDSLPAEAVIVIR
jgi:pyruvate/2-oxoglutarate dehydrogenase complex dihydrolipoamide acyltransferase (E2) component